ncbi:serine/arginine repetitive matrix protein 2 [Tripterygium wilfordii]|uniref:Serine/arginine repetitive matrix protein 2 n=1 Tax=Tripterygium wilfordii TaxID=458696 RepID=A0A7J7CKU5_TRIWF|nr:serine/arginine repetitive matrix protein 2 [Tripterygium wilfordii]
MSNAGQSCFRYPPPFHGGTPLYPTTQQNSPHPTHFGNQNVYPVQQPVAPAYGPPPPPRMLPHSSQDQSSYRAPVLQSPQVHNGVQGSQHILLAPPPPPASSLSTSAPLIPSTGGNSRMPSTALPPQPPPPSSSPPLPPPPPPPTSPFLSSMAIHATPNLPPRSDSNPDSSKLSGCGLKTSSSIDENSACSDGRDKLPEQSGSQAGYLAGKGSLSKGNMILDLPPTPPKPREEKLVQRTEALCQSIAKNGSDFEDMALLKKSGNSQFEFMLGGEPGSEAAIAHDYFLWMKKKCNLTMLDEGNCDSSSKAFAVDDKKMMVVVGSHSPADSDMEMEDDITHPDTVQVVKNSFESQNFELDSVCINSNEKECAPHSSGECKPVEAVSAKISLSVFPGPGNDNDLLDLSNFRFVEGFLLSCSLFVLVAGEWSSRFVECLVHSRLTFGSLFYTVHSPVTGSSGAPECSPAGEAVKSTSFRADNRSPPSLAAAEGIGHSPQHINDGSPFRLLQGYASDDSTGSEDEPRLEDFKTVSSAVSVDATNLLIDSECNLRTYIGLESPGKTEKQFGLPSGLAISSKAPEISAGSQGEFGITTRKTNARGAIDEHDETMLENEALINCVTICEDIQNKMSVEAHVLLALLVESSIMKIRMKVQSPPQLFQK